MTPLRQALITKLTLLRYAPKTHEAYLSAVEGLAGCYNRSPDQISNEEITRYLLRLYEERGWSASTLNVAVSGLRFFYKHVLERCIGEVESALPRPKKQRRCPQVYSREELRALFERGCADFKRRVFLKTVYSAGLRLNEACHLKPADIQSSLMMIRVNQGKGSKDRYTLLSHRLLEELRAYWESYHPRRWVFPGRRNALEPLCDGTGQKIFYDALRRAGLPNRGGIHCLRHSFATHLMEDGVAMMVIKMLMGHRSFRTTASYLHVSREHLAKVRSPLDTLEEVAKP